MATAAIKSLGRDLFHSRRDASSDDNNAHPTSPSDGQPQAVSSMIFDPSATAPPMGQPAKGSNSNHPQEQNLLGGDVPTSDPNLQLSDFEKLRTIGTGRCILLTATVISLTIQLQAHSLESGWSDHPTPYLHLRRTHSSPTPTKTSTRSKSSAKRTSSV